MPNGPKREKRSAGVICNAVMMAQIENYRVGNTTERKSGWSRSAKSEANSRAEQTSSQKFSDIVHKAVNARWER